MIYAVLVEVGGWATNLNNITQIGIISPQLIRGEHWKNQWNHHL